MKRIISIALSVLFMAGLLAGCQPTPEQDIVIGKDNDGWEEAKMPSGEEMPDLGVPKTWQSEFSGNDLEIKIDAEVDFMENTTFPVYVVQGKIFTQDEADAIMNALFGDAELYYATGGRTKSVIEKEIQHYKEELETVGKWLEEAENDKEKETYEGTIAAYQEIMQRLILEKENAPEGETHIPATREIGFVEDEQLISIYGQEKKVGDDSVQYIWTDAARKKAEADGNVGIYGMVDTGDGKVMEFMLRNRPSELMGSYFTGCSSICYDLSKDESREPHDENAVSMTREEAIQKANGMLDKMEISYEFIDCEEYHYVYDWDYEGDRYTEKSEKNPSYKIRYCTAMPNTRRVNLQPAPIDYNNGSFNSFSFPLEQEDMVIDIRADGTVGFNWNTPIETVKTELENTRLLSWDEAAAVIEKGLKMKNVYSIEMDTSSKDILSRTLKVDKIVLSYMQIKKKDNLSERYYIPVWDVIGTMTLKFRDDYDPYAEGGGYIVDENHERVSFENSSILTINAIDGTIIDRSLGY